MRSLIWPYLAFVHDVIELSCAGGSCWQALLLQQFQSESKSTQRISEEACLTRVVFIACQEAIALSTKDVVWIHSPIMQQSLDAIGPETMAACRATTANVRLWNWMFWRMIVQPHKIMAQLQLTEWLMVYPARRWWFTRVYPTKNCQAWQLRILPLLLTTPDAATWMLHRLSHQSFRSRNSESHAIRHRRNLRRPKANGQDWKRGLWVVLARDYWNTNRMSFPWKLPPAVVWSTDQGMRDFGSPESWRSTSPFGIVLS